MTDGSWMLPVLIALPILAATLPLLLGLRWEGLSWWVAMTTSAIEVVLATVVFIHVTTGEALIHSLGGFPRPIGIELVADALSAFFVVLIAVTALAVIGFTRRGGPRGRSFSSVYLLLVAGLMGVTLTGDLFNMFVFLEVTGIATYALVASRQQPSAALAAFKYLIIGTVGATLYLVGVGYLYAATGTLNMTDVAASLAGGGSADLGVLYGDPLVATGFVFIFAGLAAKVAMFPLHSWQPDAYAEAPDAVSAFISALVSTVAAYAMVRIMFDVFTVSFFEVTPWAWRAIVVVGTVSIIVGSTLAVLQHRLKRMLAYSSVAQFGLVVAAIGIAAGPAHPEVALVGVVIHLLGHAVMKGGLFAGVGAIASATGARTLEEYAGLGQQHPVIGGSLAVLGLALVGVPPSIGFIGKWYIALGAIEAGVWTIAAVILLSTLLTLGYIVRILERVYFRTATTESTTIATDGQGVLSPSMVAVPVLAAIAVVLLGFLGGPLTEMIEPFVQEVLSP